MLKIVFKNLEPSQLARDIVKEKIEPVIGKFPSLADHKVTLTLEMENSPAQAGPDLFSVKLHVVRGRYDGVTVEKSDASLYVALAEVVDHMLEVLNRFGDRARVKERTRARELTKELGNNSGFEER